MPPLRHPLRSALYLWFTRAEPPSSLVRSTSFAHFSLCSAIVPPLSDPVPSPGPLAPQLGHHRRHQCHHGLAVFFWWSVLSALLRGYPRFSCRGHFFHSFCYNLFPNPPTFSGGWVVGLKTSSTATRFSHLRAFLAHYGSALCARGPPGPPFAICPPPLDRRPRSDPHGGVHWDGIPNHSICSCDCLPGRAPGGGAHIQLNLVPRIGLKSFPTAQPATCSAAAAGHPAQLE